MTTKRQYRTTTLAILTAMSIALAGTGCSTVQKVGNKFTKKDEVVVRAEKDESAYYQEAESAIAKGRYHEAIIALNNIRTFYPTGRYAQQALLDLIYAHYQANDFEAVTNTTAQFIQSYPQSPELDYVLYAQGVTHMGGSPKSARVFKMKQSERDTAFLRLAFDDFRNLLARYPDSVYAPDVAQRMLAIYNDFAEHELVAARWYIKRKAYVAAANRAKWVFQYYPQSTAVPEATAILAYTNEQLGLPETANQYKTVLKINYPQYLNSRNQVIVPSATKLGVGKRLSKSVNQGLNLVSFGKLGRAGDSLAYYQDEKAVPYAGQTRTPRTKQSQQNNTRMAGMLELAPARD